MNYQEIVNKNVIDAISKFQKKKVADALESGQTEEQVMKSVGVNPNSVGAIVGGSVPKTTTTQPTVQAEAQPSAMQQAESKFSPDDFSTYRIEVVPAKEANTTSGITIDQQTGTMYVSFGGTNSDGSILNRQLEQIDKLQALRGLQPMQRGDKEAMGLQMVEGMAKQQMAGQQQESKDLKDLRKSYFKLQEDANAPLSGELNKASQNINDIEDGLNLMEANLKNRKSMMPGDKKKQAFDRGLKKAASSYGYLKSGATIGVKEYDRLASLLPDPNALALESENTSKAKIAEMRASIAQAKEAMNAKNASKKQTVTDIDKFKAALINNGYSEGEATDEALSYFNKIGRLG